MSGVSAYRWGSLALVAVIIAVVLWAGEGAGLWFMTVLLGACAFVLLCSLVMQLKNAGIRPVHSYARDFPMKFVATLMGFFLVEGTLLYMYVFYTIGHDGMTLDDIGHPVEFSNAEYLLRSLICSLDLFMLDVDGGLLDRLDRHAALKGWLSFQAVMSFSCTVALLVGLVYSRLNAYCRLNFRSVVDDGKNHLYLFFGNNDPSLLLIRDIVRQDPKAVAVIIDEANIDEDDSGGWDGIVGLLAHKRKVFKCADSAGAYVAIASQQFDDIDVDITAEDEFDAFGYIGLPRIRRLISRLGQTAGAQLHIFFMGEDEERNIRNIIALAKDRTMRTVAADKAMAHRIYCHARYNGPNRVVQDVALKKHLDIRIVDSSHMAIELLKLDRSYHPVNVVGISRDNPATVETPFTALIVGFGEVGRDAFRFLYEFGAFVDSSDTDRRSPFECVVVDKDLDKIKGTFMASMPAVFSGDTTGRSVRFEPVDHNSADFHGRVLTDEFAGKVNYVVISIGDNDEAIALATRVFNRVRRCREDISNLRILVRCTDDSKTESIQKIADHYNFGYGKEEENTPVILIFGQPEKTYTYDLVVSDRLIEEGKVFHEKYRELSGEGLTWDERHVKHTDTGTPKIDDLRKLRRQESQDRANALHAGTKMILLKNAMGHMAEHQDVDWDQFYMNYFNADGIADVAGSGADIRYPELSACENLIVRHLAMLEHMRWNAAHELMGYEFNDSGNECDERTMRHNCLCPWSRLDGQSAKITDWVCDYKRYDFCVVDTTVALYRKYLETEGEN